MKKELRNRFRELLIEKFGSEDDIPAQGVIAVELDLSTGTVSRWMNNKVDRIDSHVVEKMCDYFNCDLSDLLYLAEVA